MSGVTDEGGDAGSLRESAGAESNRKTREARRHEKRQKALENLSKMRDMAKERHDLFDSMLKELRELRSRVKSLELEKKRLQDEVTDLRLQGNDDVRESYAEKELQIFKKKYDQITVENIRLNKELGKVSKRPPLPPKGGGSYANTNGGLGLHTDLDEAGYPPHIPHTPRTAAYSSHDGLLRANGGSAPFRRSSSDHRLPFHPPPGSAVGSAAGQRSNSQSVLDFLDPEKPKPPPSPCHAPHRHPRVDDDGAETERSPPVTSLAPSQSGFPMSPNASSSSRADPQEDENGLAMEEVPSDDQEEEEGNKLLEGAFRSLTASGGAREGHMSAGGRVGASQQLLSPHRRRDGGSPPGERGTSLGVRRERGRSQGGYIGGIERDRDRDRGGAPGGVRGGPTYPASSRPRLSSDLQPGGGGGYSHVNGTSTGHPHARSSYEHDVGRVRQSAGGPVRANATAVRGLGFLGGRREFGLQGLEGGGVEVGGTERDEGSKPPSPAGSWFGKLFGGSQKADTQGHQAAANGGVPLNGTPLGGGRKPGGWKSSAPAGGHHDGRGNGGENGTVGREGLDDLGNGPVRNDWEYIPPF
uniref:Uncharacterized protein n=1 Tax=Chromera velia CCMP2878 TaxID=1169474 RepID=A0A0G4I922_9ALVE|eukprot:Cvel_12117.t1-p1 / transcript=Cvel_12117.t1 / gene=Cvel_12117 / organism=Chromera_velia_CCMP2878 / gene_product=hypothetical protein / transcript_product=hypothetical protein / location=Cvel_scaffold780:61828-64264(+) / protein_length=583 / sequence_SO=supercontig / SO=protein_coding / is_pseudo=false